jgi:AraC-like DNA-binding protein
VRSNGQRQSAPLWDIALPAGPIRTPSLRLAGFSDRGSTPICLRTVPHPAVTVVVELGDSRLVVDDGTGRPHRGSLVAGLAVGSASVRGDHIECLQARLSPVIARAVLGFPLSELGREAVALEDVWGPTARHVGERLHSARSWGDRFAFVDAMLAQRFDAGRCVDREVAWVWDRTARSSGRAGTAQLAAEIGWSRKRLWSRFRSQLGLTPKRAATLVRFDQAAHRLVAGDGAARVAADTGFADQSHLHRDVVAFTGLTPASLANEPWLAVDDVAWRT